MVEEKDKLQYEDKAVCCCADCSETAASPWPPGTSYISTALFSIPVSMGAYALLKKAPRRIPIFAALWVVISTVVRKVTCCRCEGYGENCSTLMGKWTAMIYERDEENPLTAKAFYLDFALIGASMLYPLPQVAKMGKRYLVLYILALLAGGAGIRQLACKHCPVTVCFMNPKHKIVDNGL